MFPSAAAYEVTAHALAAGIGAPKGSAYLAHIGTATVSIVIIWIVPIPVGLVVQVVEGIPVFKIRRIHIDRPLDVAVSPVIPTPP